MSQIIDLNCDLGEGCPYDADLMPLVSSVSIACGFHAGGPASAMAALRAAKEHGVLVGAHPGYDDPEAFGRRELARTEQQVFEDTVYQIGALAGLAQALAIKLTHVKPHGALYHQASRDETYARPIVEAARQFGLAVFGPPASKLESACAGHCLFVSEGFADRRYLPDGQLVSRSQADAFMHNPGEAADQIERLVRECGVRTICFHGDNPEALRFALSLRSLLAQRGVRIRPYSASQVPSPSMEEG